MKEKPKIKEIRPQPGPQMQFACSSADIVIYGGAAGGGKTFAILMEMLRHAYNSKFIGVILRETYKQILQAGGLWDESEKLYTQFGASPNLSNMSWTFPSGMQVQYSYLSSPTDHLQYQGAQIPLICFDELTHFSEKHFFYMASRLRSDSSVSGYIRATCNPDPDSWVLDFIDWWIGEDGFPIHDRSGVIRWFIRDGDKLRWSDSKEYLIGKYGEEQMPKSVTFIPASLEDNKILMENDPQYKSNLMALPEVERAQLLGGNWRIRPAAGMYFKADRFKYCDANDVPELSKTVRYWDRAATAKTATNDPDYTVGVLMGKAKLTETWYVLDVVRFREDPAGNLRNIMKTAEIDGIKITQVLEEDPGQAGKVEVAYLIGKLAGYPAKANRVSKDKLTRATPFSGQALTGNVYLVRDKWNKDYVREHESFAGDGKGHDDQVDASSGAFNELTTKRKKSRMG